jgi:hypothetical protein
VRHHDPRWWRQVRPEPWNRRLAAGVAFTTAPPGFLLEHRPPGLHLVMSAGPTRRCRWPGCAPAGSSPRCATSLATARTAPTRSRV